ncbi:hypothetical protein LCGC14_0479640 [marine sediment metagenome]|uniref:Uncharacterized protein n=1 Tax=marine sediment metagenome TaxID=412755 RepID=A0A0F9VIH5_9ZZZZ
MGKSIRDFRRGGRKRNKDVPEKEDLLPPMVVVAVEDVLERSLDSQRWDPEKG